MKKRLIIGATGASGLPVTIECLKILKKAEDVSACLIMSDSAWKRLWNSYLSELNFRYGDFSRVLVPDEYGNMQAFQKPKSRFAPVKIPMVIEPFTAHYLRHTYITMLYFAGVDVLTAKEQAGHSDVNTTLAIYTHLDKQHKVHQISKLNEYIDGCQMGVSSSERYKNIG